MAPRIPPARVAIVLALVGVMSLIASAVAGWYPQPTREHEVMIDNFLYTPSDLVIRAGDLIGWRVADGSHSATAVGVDWNSGLLAPGESFSRRFRQVGTTEYRCELHPFMRGSIRVEPGPQWRGALFWGMMILTLGLFLAWTRLR